MTKREIIERARQNYNPEAYLLPPDHPEYRHLPGIAGLAHAILADAKDCGVQVDDRWVEYLKWHTDTMRGNRVIKHGGVI